MKYFCTLFDSKYLLQGLALHESLMQFGINFHLFIFAFDDISYGILVKLNFTNVTVISLREFEDNELKVVKPFRSVSEYCWTCSSSAILFVFNNYKVPNCIYVDADIFFYDSPDKLINELSEGKNIIITRHNYSENYKHLLDRGEFCVQFVYFENKPDALLVLNEWRNDCLNWCYARIEDGKFGDQKYLDAWPIKYRNVHIMNSMGAGIAPWNISDYRISNVNKKTSVYNLKESLKSDLFFYHFHGLKLYRNKWALNCINFSIHKNAIRTLYIPYIKELWKIEKELKTKFKFSIENKEKITRFRYYRNIFYFWRKRHFSN